MNNDWGDKRRQVADAGEASANLFVKDSDLRSTKRKREMAAYQKRNECLARLGFGSYRDYLASDSWRDIRGRVLLRDGGMCTVCQRPAAHVHHMNYSESGLRGTNLRALRSLCAGCHVMAEFARYGKTSPKAARRRLHTKHRRLAKAWLKANNPEYHRLLVEIAILKKQPKTQENMASRKVVQKKLRSFVRGYMNGRTVRLPTAEATETER